MTRSEDDAFHAFSVFEIEIQPRQEILLLFLKTVTKTIRLWFISLAKLNVVWSYFLVEIPSLTIQLQFISMSNFLPWIYVF